MDLVRDVVMLEQPGQYPARAEGIGLEGNEDEDGRRERVSRLLEVYVELGDQGSRKIHDYQVLCASLAGSGARIHRSFGGEGRQAGSESVVVGGKALNALLRGSRELLAGERTGGSQTRRVSKK